MQFKLDLRLARLLGIHTQTRPVIINALWQYIKTHRLQDPAEREYINCDKYLEQVPPLSTLLVLLWVHTVDHPWVRGLGDGSWLVWDPPASGPRRTRIHQLRQVPRTGGSTFHCARSVVSSYCGPSVGPRVRGWVVVGVRSTGFRTLPSTSISAVTSTSNRCLLAFCLLSFIFWPLTSSLH